MAPVKEPESKNYFTEASKRHSFSSASEQILAESPQEQQPVAEALTADGPIEDTNFLRRTSQGSPSNTQFVVGSAYPEILSAKDSQSASTKTESVPEHGPRRRRGAVVVQRKKTKKLDDNELDNENEPSIDDLEKSMEVSTESANNDKDTITTSSTTTGAASSTTTTQAVEDVKSESTTAGVNYYETESVGSVNSTFGDFFKRMFQLKLKLGVSFLRGMADGVARYLHQFEERLYRSTNYHMR